MNNRITCFLIDDDKDDQEIFMLALEDMNIDVACVTANDGNEALQKFAQDESFMPDFIFLDLNMPRTNGKQCLIEIKKIDHLKDVPVIIYSTSSAQKDKAETEMLGATAFITKPSSISEFTKILSHYLINGSAAKSSN